ncbi:hypothetical protein [Chroococcus sp. FPU101]|uniref:hypothetical protein n=1 Tax=Chroococcus sp. FPU101 TaxID=1974212 RepID=UPI001A8E616B|nr:hypothetical protein [Chroococcus sp. FPU101]GFE71884.1 hypothetical protein CFPU101_44940 [Chroococcus sp. FPU101]
MLLNNLLDALNLFSHSGQVPSLSKKLPNLKTALRKYILPNLPNYSFSAGDLEREKLEFCLEEVTVESFLLANPLKILSESCQALVSQGLLARHVERTTYRPALLQFQTWLLEQQQKEEEKSNNNGKYAPKTRYQKNIKKANQGRANYQKTQYALKESELTPQLCQELANLHLFCCGEYVPARQDQKMREKTFQNHRQRVLGVLGWLKNIQGETLDVLEIKKLADVRVIEQYISWGINTRGNTCGWAMGICDLALNIAKWQFCHESKRPQYRDIPIIEEIRMINNRLAKRYEEQKQAAKRSKRTEKEMTFAQCQEIVLYLRRCCAPKDSYGSPRSEMALARAWQRYLLVAILTYCPVRQRELREFELGRTLHRNRDGYCVSLQPEDNKTGDERCFMLSDLLPPIVVADLDQWIDVWLPKFRIATENLDNWLGFIGRREYKNQMELEQYLSHLQQQKEEILKAGNTEKAAQLEKRYQSGLRNYETQVQARRNFRENFLFVSTGSNIFETFGLPIKAGDLFSIVRSSVYTASAALAEQEHPLFKGIEPRKTNPHYFRNIAITHERRYGDPTKRKAFHKVLGNSEKIGDKDYNEMYPEEKTVDAKNWWQSETGSDSFKALTKIKKLLPSLTSRELIHLKQLLEQNLSLLV